MVSFQQRCGFWRAIMTEKGSPPDSREPLIQNPCGFLGITRPPLSFPVLGKFILSLILEGKTPQDKHSVY